MATGWEARIRELFRPTVVVNPPTVVVNPPAPEPEDLLEAALELAQTQLLGQFEHLTSLDGQTMGWLAFLGALLAVDVAAKGLLARWWWTPLVGVTAATIPCLLSIFESPPELGPRIIPFYERYGAAESRAARTQLLADIYESFRKNGERVQRKRRRLWAAVVITIVGLSGAALVITLDTPTKIKGHDTESTKTTSHRQSPPCASPGARPLTCAPGHLVRLGR